MKKYKFFLYALLLPLLAAQCNKPSEDGELPPITTEGKNTFGCRVNGEVWIPWREFDLFHTAITVSYHTPTGGVNIAAKKKMDDLELFQTISFSSTNIKDIGEYKYNNATYSDFDTSFCINFAFDFDTAYVNKLEILRLDTENRIISGTFEFTAVNDECEPVIITDGRFDLKY